ncbi:MAG: S8 family peptidase [Chloroflexi bacterium]|nr:S8 family peptidase [Chloroflexota bacterium]
MAKNPASGGRQAGDRHSASTSSDLPESLPRGVGPKGTRSKKSTGFTPLSLDRTIIAVPLLDQLGKELRLKSKTYNVVVDINLRYRGGRNEARERVIALIGQAIASKGTKKDRAHQGVNAAKSQYSEQYVFAKLEGEVIRELVRLDHSPEPSGTGSTETDTAVARAIHRIWPDFDVAALTFKSVKTVKADAARISYSALGEDIVWAVLDSGIQGDHSHFRLHQNLEHLPSPLEHIDFTQTGDPLVDEFGHGTHVAGILAGELIATLPTVGVTEAAAPVLAAPLEAAVPAPAAAPRYIRAYARQRDEHGEVKHEPLQVRAISGVAPKCKLVSMKVLDGAGDGLASSLIVALEHIQKINGYGRRLIVHGVNMSVGYSFEPEWFACGQSPLCVEVDRLVRSGVVVVVAAGNTGYGWTQSEAKGAVAAGQDLTINDPGNAELAITVGSTHRDMPHVYGVSYFSSKGPTGDGRSKPDLVAPGEKIISCAAGQKRLAGRAAVGGDIDYTEDSGTSMAAPHVSGAIAAFLSIRSEFIGRPERVKEIFLASATDLKRERTFQGHGLVDLMRAIQSV